MIFSKLKCSVGLALLLCGTITLAQPYRAPADRDAEEVRDLEIELQNKMTGTYTIAITGDLLFQEPAGKRISASIRNVLKSADTTIGNLEGYLVDRQSWAGKQGYRNNWAPKELATDLAELGFDLVAPGEADGGEDAQTETMKYLDAAGIKRPGYGLNLSLARQPAFQELPQGRVALVAAFPIGPVGTGPIASNKDGNDGGEEAGMNPLRLTQWVTVTQEQFDQLKAMRETILARRGEADVARPTDIPRDKPGRLNFVGKNYLVAEKPGEFRYEMNANDRQSQVLAVRNAKEYADFVGFTMHIHENRYAFQAYSQDHYPPDYVRVLARELIDNGADMFLGHGNHTMQGIEIYKGRPIFYNPGNFAVQRFGSDDSPPNPENLTNIEASEPRNSWLQQYINLVAYVAQSRYENGRLTEIRIYPVDLGVNFKKVPWSRSSIPQTPEPEIAKRILTELQTYSAPFGTKIEISGGIGIIRIPSDATLRVGGDLKIPGRGSTQGAAEKIRP
ncbi:Capsule synthesis protein, CapA [Sphingomonadaceae bacterium]